MLRLALILATCLLLAGCAVGPGGGRAEAPLPRTEDYRLREVHRSPVSGVVIYEVTGPDGEKRTVRVRDERP